MAKAGDASSTIVWIWLREALALATEALGSAALAEKRLVEWLAAGELPWRCMSWEGLDAEGITKLHQSYKGSGILIPLPSVAYYEGNPKFWHAPNLKIDWEDNLAREAEQYGAKALGAKVSRTALIVLLPPEDRPGERGELHDAKADAPLPNRRRRAGRKPEYDWGAIQAHCHQWFDDNGYPTNVSAFCEDELIPWCVARYSEDGPPDIETLRPKVREWIDASERSLLPK